ncbi:MAG TPA: hypothetical protein VGG92_06555 [Caulobacteraceae bacterium]|jgi:hypothetical protein
MIKRGSSRGAVFLSCLCLPLVVAAASAKTPKEKSPHAAVTPATRHICWISRVDKAGTGVDVSFSATRSVSVVHAGAEDTYLVRATGLPPGLGESDSLSALHLEVGDRFASHNGPEDACSMEVVVQNGQIGVAAHAAVHLPGLPASEASDFIPAN